MSKRKSKVKPSRPKRKNLPKIKRKINPMMIALIFGGVLLLGAIALLLPKGEDEPEFVPEVSGSPRLKTDRELIDLGDIPMEQWVTASFDLTNVGDQPLRFNAEPYIEVKEGC